MTKLSKFKHNGVKVQSLHMEGCKRSMLQIWGCKSTALHMEKCKRSNLQTQGCKSCGYKFWNGLVEHSNIEILQDPWPLYICTLEFAVLTFCTLEFVQFWPLHLWVCICLNLVILSSLDCHSTSMWELELLSCQLTYAHTHTHTHTHCRRIDDLLEQLESDTTDIR